jgi:hypothetical protein
MALSISNRGSGTHNTGAASFTLSATSNLAAGSTAVLCIAADNSGGAGDVNDFTTVTDTLGNTWTKRQSPVFDNGAASAGVQGAIFTTYQNAGAIQTGTVITVSTTSSPVAKTWTLTEIVPAAGTQAQFRTGGNKSAGATGTVLAMGASVTVNIGEVIVAAFFLESGTTQSVTTPDADVTNGSWSTNQYNEIGSTTSGSGIISQAKLQTTANSTQSYDVTVGISSDYHGSYVIFTEIAAPQTITPTTAIAAAAAASPTITLGALAITPTQAAATSAAASPTVTLGAITVTPTTAAAAATAAAPTVANAVNVTPTTAIAASSAASPTVTLGSLALTPTQATATSSATSPTVARGALVITPTQAVATSSAAAPTVTRGAIAVTPTAAIAAATVAVPTVDVGGGAQNITPTQAVAASSAAAPTVTPGALAITPTTAIASGTAAAPVVVRGALTLTPTAAIATSSAAAPVVANQGGLAVVVIAADIRSPLSTVIVITRGSSVEV